MVWRCVQAIVSNTTCRHAEYLDTGMLAHTSFLSFRASAYARCRWAASARSRWDRLLGIPRRSRCAQRKIPQGTPYASCAADERGNPFAALRVTVVFGTWQDACETVLSMTTVSLHVVSAEFVPTPRGRRIPFQTDRSATGYRSRSTRRAAAHRAAPPAG